MTGIRVITGALVALAAVGCCLPQAVLAAGPAAGRTPVLMDVALMDGGVLIGQVVDTQGTALTKVPVSVWDHDREIATTATDGDGYFSVGGLRGGVCRIVAAGVHGPYRLWAPGTAPPVSQPSALLVVGHDTVRAQSCGPCCGPWGGALNCWLSNPWVVAGVVATAVTVPIAIHNSKRPTSP